MLIKYPNICLAIFENNYKYTIILYIYHVHYLYILSFHFYLLIRFINTLFIHIFMLTHNYILYILKHMPTINGYFYSKNTMT